MVVKDYTQAVSGLVIPAYSIISLDVDIPIKWSTLPTAICN